MSSRRISVKQPKPGCRFEIERPLGDSSVVNSVGCVAAGGRYEEKIREDGIVQFGAGDSLV